jgi:hypothetical protein
VSVSIPLNTVQPVDTIFVDSCAGASVFADASFFVCMEAPTQNTSIHFGPNDPIPVAAIGTIAFAFKPNQGVHANKLQTVVLHDVYYVPQQHMNLLSVSTLHEHNSGANFDKRPGNVRFSTKGGDSCIDAAWKKICRTSLFRTQAS